MATPAAVLSTPQFGKIDTVEIDCVLSEQHSWDNEVTDHDVEDGAKISDHIRSQPDKLTLECLITNTPLSRTQQTRSVQAGGTTFQSATQDDTPRNAPGNAQAAHDKLHDLKEGGQLVTVVTSLRTYKSMAIENVSIPRDKETGEALKFTVNFRTIRLVKNRTVPNTISSDDRVGKKKHEGHKTNKAPGIERSALKKAYSGDYGNSISNGMKAVGRWAGLGGGDASSDSTDSGSANFSE